MALCMHTNKTVTSDLLTPDAKDALSEGIGGWLEGGQGLIRIVN